MLLPSILLKLLLNPFVVDSGTMNNSMKYNVNRIRNNLNTIF